MGSTARIAKLEALLAPGSGATDGERANARAILEKLRTQSPAEEFSWGTAVPGAGSEGVMYGTWPPPQGFKVVNSRGEEVKRPRPDFEDAINEILRQENEKWAKSQAARWDVYEERDRELNRAVRAQADAQVRWAAASAAKRLEALRREAARQREIVNHHIAAWASVGTLLLWAVGNAWMGALAVGAWLSGEPVWILIYCAAQILFGYWLVRRAGITFSIFRKLRTLKEST